MKKVIVGDGQRRVPLGAPLFLGEAAFLQNELRRRGIDVGIHSDESLGPITEAIHSLMVLTVDLDRACAARDQILPSGEETARDGDAGTDGEVGRLTKSALAACLGFLGGARLARGFHGGSPWRLALPALLGAAAFVLTLAATGQPASDGGGPIA